MEKLKRQCFLIHSFDVNIKGIRNFIEEKQFNVLSSEDILVGANIEEEIFKLIKKADLIVVILTDKKRDNVLFELGYAFGLNKQILVISKTPSLSLPFNVRNILHLQTDLENYDAIGFALEQLQIGRASCRERVSDYV